METCGTPLVTGHQSKVTPLNKTPCAQPMSPSHNVFIQLWAGHFFQDSVKDSIECFTEIQEDYVN